MLEATASIALALLVVAGVAKVVEPEFTDGALRATGLPSGVGIVRVLGMAEVMAGIAGLVFGGSLAAPAALFYAGFSLFTGNALRRDVPIQSCGCFGREDTPPSFIHLVFNVIATVTLGIVASTGMTALPAGTMAETVLYVSFVGLGTFASVLLMTRLPTVLRLTRS